MVCELHYYFSPLRIAYRLLPTAYRPLHSKEAGWKGLLAGLAESDKMSLPTGKETASNSKKLTNDAGMSMKTNG